MPLYNFKCPACKKAFEMLVSSSETPVCPKCGSETIERQIGQAAPPGKLAGVAKAARAQAAREGHLSNFSRSERRR